MPIAALAAKIISGFQIINSMENILESRECKLDLVEKKKKLKEGITDQNLKLISNCFRSLEFILSAEKKPFRIIINPSDALSGGFDPEF